MTMTAHEIAARHDALDARYCAAVARRLGIDRVRIVARRTHRTGATEYVFGVPRASVAQARALGLFAEVDE